VCALAQDSSRSRISREAISSDQPRGKKTFFVEQIAPAWRLKYAGALLSGLRTRWSSLRGKFALERSSSIVLEARGANSSLGNPAPGGNPGLKRTRIGAIVKTTFKLKINIKRNP
jgi:hypothetical protein